MRYWSSPPWPTVDVAHEKIARDAKALASGEYLTLGIESTANGRLIGRCTLFSFVDQCKRSARTLQRLGFLHEGYLRERWIVNGEVSDSALYGLLRREWQRGSV